MTAVDLKAMFRELPAEPVTAKVLSRELERLLMRHINELPVELRIRDMFEIGVQRGWISERPDGLLVSKVD